MSIPTNNAFDQANAQSQKTPVLVFDIEGSPFVFTSAVASTTIRYDDPGVLYDGTYVYDGLRPIVPGDSKDQLKILDRKGGKSVLVQKIEQWDGRASIETLGLKLLNSGGVITQLVAPGILIDEILNKKVKVFFGYTTISYPDQFIRVFTGYVNSYTLQGVNGMFQFSDASKKRKLNLFNNSTSSLTAAIDNSQTTIPVTSTDNFYTTILNAKGVADTGVTMGFRIDDEIIKYENTDIFSQTQLQTVTRGQFTSTADAHDINTQIIPFLHIEDNAINIALKIMLSGWNGPWIDSINLRGIVNKDGGSPTASTITFKQGVDVRRDYGIVPGDFLIITGSAFPVNNDTWTVSSFLNDGRTIVVVESGLVQENPSGSGFLPATVAFRSKYDVYPVLAGLKLTPDEVNVSRYEYFRTTFLPYNMKFDIEGYEKSGKEWIEKELMKPLGAYSLNQGAKISMGLTHPPLATDVIPILNQKNVLNGPEITVERGLNSRWFYNEVIYSYGWDPIKKNFTQFSRYIDADAVTRMDQVSTLTVESKGWHLGDELSLSQRSNRVIRRCRYSCELVSNIRTFFGVGNTIDSGDVVMLDDDQSNPVLKIPNTETGQRGIFGRLMEVQERKIDLSEGKAEFSLLGNLGFSASDRFATVSPTSAVQAGSTSSRVIIAASFGALFGTEEWKKWVNFQGSTIRVHNAAFTNDAETTYTLDPVNPNILNVTPPLPFTPGAGYFVQFAKYSSDPNINTAVKSAFCHLDSTAPIASASSQTVFTLSPGYAARYDSTMFVYVMSPNGVRYSQDVKILSVIGNIVTVNKPLGFTPLAGDLMQLGGFLDGKAGYRYA